eukprot:2076502-Rhodomonas_salina.2
MSGTDSVYAPPSTRRVCGSNQHYLRKLLGTVSTTPHAMSGTDLASGVIVLPDSWYWPSGWSCAVWYYLPTSCPLLGWLLVAFTIVLRPVRVHGTISTILLRDVGTEVGVPGGKRRYGRCGTGRAGCSLRTAR